MEWAVLFQAPVRSPHHARCLQEGYWGTGALGWPCVSQLDSEYLLKQQTWTEQARQQRRFLPRGPEFISITYIWGGTQLPATPARGNLAPFITSTDTYIHMLTQNHTLTKAHT